MELNQKKYDIENIANTIEGGGENYVKVLTGESVDTRDHISANFYAYTESEGWVNLTDNSVSSAFITEVDILEVYVITNNGFTQFPTFIAPGDYVTSETHTPESNVPGGYYIEYADDYSIFYAAEDRATIVLKNGVVNYYAGVA